jgi:2,3-bisphosphoglycerate-dependent phosphoglycerate mutase
MSELPPVHIALVRHGRFEQPAGVPSAHLPHPLTADGLVDARAGAAELMALAQAHGLQLTGPVFTSPLLRARQTADVLAAELRAAGHAEVAVVEDPALAERSLGALANLSEAEIEAVLARDPRAPRLRPGWKSDASLRLPALGAESLLQAGARVAACLRAVADALADAAVAHPPLGAAPPLAICVGHGGAFRHAAAVLGALALTDVRLRSMHHGRPVILTRDAAGTWSAPPDAWKRRSHPGADG